MIEQLKIKHLNYILRYDLAGFNKEIQIIFGTMLDFFNFQCPFKQDRKTNSNLTCYVLNLQFLKKNLTVLWLWNPKPTLIFGTMLNLFNFMCPFNQDRTNRKS